jgi:hypothetical protein
MTAQETSPIDDLPEGYFVIWTVQLPGSDRTEQRMAGYYDSAEAAAEDVRDWWENTDDGWQAVEATVKPKDRLTFEELKLWSQVS